MSHKQLTNDPGEFSAWLRNRAKGHAPGFDIAVYARPAVWLAMADAIEAVALSPPEPTEPCCPFCGRDPFHYVDNGVGMEAVAVTCCELGVELYRRTGDTVEMSRDDFVGIANRLRAMPLQDDRPQLIEMLRVSGANLETAAFVLDRRGDPEHAAVMRKAAAQILPLLAEQGTT